ncbi:MAG: tRNA (N(6)-L-threonylcarbamoyladenosine(37)-C(2))-methylthiotransferase MtaB [Deltaproteobacteria bacterium]|nr:tRNA (N(6)-L-threonylcarbamoyladenosine(37)-C(2))-methylthiotransferase MtaB [Deltaproteobacteria bacterium]
MDRKIGSFCITTLGCKVNRCESEAIAARLVEQGWKPIEPDGKATLCVVNTCTVTQRAAMQSRQAVRQLVRRHPNALMVATGCYAQVVPEALAAIPQVHYVVGNTAKMQIPQLAGRRPGGNGATILVEAIAGRRSFEDLPVGGFSRRTRAFVKIQDGCDAFCTYCIVPYARGPSRSLSPEGVLEKAVDLVRQGHEEIVLTGIHIGHYGQDLVPEISLVDLIRVLECKAKIGRLRLSSIEPAEITDDLVRVIADSECLCPHLHIPLQSGDDGVLSSMHRPYTARGFRDLIHQVVEALPDVGIGIDVMGGFPGETQKAFEHTCRLIETLPVAYLHVFPFSPHKTTPAHRLPNPVAHGVKKRRCQVLRKLGQIKRTQFYERFVGSTMEVLIEGKRDRATGLLQGFTPNYIPVLVPGDDRLMHHRVRVSLEAVKDGRVYGRPAP